MSKYLIDSTTLTSIGDAVRGKTGGTDPILVSDLATTIENIQNSGSDDSKYGYIHIVPNNTNKYIPINLYDYVDDLDDIELIFYRQTYTAATLWSASVAKSLGIPSTRDNVPSSISGTGNCARQWGDLFAAETSNDTCPIYVFIKDNGSSYGFHSIGWFPDVNRMYVAGGGWSYRYYTWGWSKTSFEGTTVYPDASYNCLFICYKIKGEG